MALDAPNDPRWKAFNERGFACSCGEKHVGLFPINLLYPIGWPGSKDYVPDESITLDGNFLSANFCVWEGKYFAMRMRLPLGIRGAEPWAFMFTVWASLNRADFEGYLEAWRTKKLNKDARAAARLVNRLNVYPDTNKLMGSAFQQEDGGVPLLLIYGPQPDNIGNHPLINDQVRGIGMDRVLELFASYGHDMRAEAGA